MFSPMVATRWVSSSADRAAGAGIGGGLDRLQVLADLQRDLGHGLDEGLERLVAGDEVGLGVDLDHRGLAGRARRRRPAPRRRRGRTSWRRRRGPSCAASRSRLRSSPPVSVSAFLQSIMPAPVFSRRSFTRAAVISAMCSLLYAFAREDICPRARRSVLVPGALRHPKQYQACASASGAASRIGSAASPTSIPAEPISALMPSSTAPATRSQYSVMARIASSLPGTGIGHAGRVGVAVEHRDHRDAAACWLPRPPASPCWCR